MKIVLLSAVAMVLNVGFAVPRAEAKSDSDGIRLLYDFKTGDSLIYNSVSTMRQKMSMPSGEMDYKTKTELGVKVKVKESLLKSSSLVITYDKAVVEFTVASGSGKDTLPKRSEIPNVTGIPMHVTLEPNGKLTKNLDDGVDRTTQELTTLIASTKILQRIFVPLPSTDVVPGSKWEQEVNDTSNAPNGLGEIVTTGTLTLSYRGLADTLGSNCWIVDVVSNNLRQHGEVKRGTAQITFDGGGSVVGVTINDAESGALVESTTRTTSDIIMNVTGELKIMVPVSSTADMKVQLQRGNK